MIKEELSFLEALRNNPNDETSRLVYADWLEDNGNSEKAAYLRHLVVIRNASRSLEEVKKKVFDRDWLSDVEGTEDEYEAYVIRKGLKTPPFKEVSEMEVGTVGTGDFNAFLGDSIKDRYDHLYLRIMELGNVVFRKAIKEGEGWIYTSPEICSIFETSSYGFEPSKVIAPFKKQGENDNFFYRGTLSARWKIYTHNLFPVSEILIGIGKGKIPPENVGRFNLINFIL